ncbi:hypothetical protein PHMEG_00015146 [Phytophthora megakarya]|uniref:Uncharacterized protein n=1 Tax=Phytophthora megakarya TaxID=4795 RepID=A0A225W3K2_9STRA|nr:hypothetical protein PHMEG_00015146 [Phytophthora megakarya]
MAQTLERHCLKRLEGGATNRAPACTKEDLRILMDGLYFDATSSKDYQDAALFALMWYAFGRASDLGFIAKNNLTVLRSDTAEKLKLWDENSDWTPTEAAKKRGVLRTTLSGWRGDPKLSADKGPGENGDRFRAKGAGRKHRLEEYECDAIAFYDKRLAEGETVTHSVMREHCKTKYPAFALKDVPKQHNWITRFLKCYKPSPSVVRTSASTQPDETVVEEVIPTTADGATQTDAVETTPTEHDATKTVVETQTDEVVETTVQTEAEVPKTVKEGMAACEADKEEEEEEEEKEEEEEEEEEESEDDSYDDDDEDDDDADEDTGCLSDDNDSSEKDKRKTLITSPTTRANLRSQLLRPNPLPSRQSQATLNASHTLATTQDWVALC